MRMKCITPIIIDIIIHNRLHSPFVFPFLSSIMYIKLYQSFAFNLQLKYKIDQLKPNTRQNMF